MMMMENIIVIPITILIINATYLQSTSKVKTVFNM